MGGGGCVNYVLMQQALEFIMRGAEVRVVGIDSYEEEADKQNWPEDINHELARDPYIVCNSEFMCMRPLKEDIYKSILKQLEEQLNVLAKALSIATDATTHADAKSEGKYDTRAIESGYLAGAQAQRVKELQGKIAAIKQMKVRTFTDDDAVAPGAVVRVGGSWLMILPSFGGIEVTVGEQRIQIIAPHADRGRELLGLYVGDFVDDDEITDIF